MLPSALGKAVAIGMLLATAVAGSSRTHAANDPAAPSGGDSQSSGNQKPVTVEAVPGGEPGASDFDPSGVVLTAEQRQKAQWALLSQAFAEKDPTKLSPTAADLAFSPASVVNALQALWWGTRGETAMELAQLFGAAPGGEAGAPAPEPAEPEAAAPATPAEPAAPAGPAGEVDVAEAVEFALVADATGKGSKSVRPSALGGSVNLSVGSSLWLDQTFPVKEEYQKLLSERGLGQAETVNWAETEASLDKLNQWGSDVTDGRIKTLMKSGDIKPPVAFVLASVVSFQGSWATAFDPEASSKADFTLLNGDKIPATYMTATRKTQYTKLDDDTEVLTLPFANGQQRFVAVLPAKPGAEALKKLEEDITEMPTWLKQLEEKEVSISLPKFATGSSSDPKSTLQSLGVKRIFSEQLADFSGASDQNGLKLDVIRHHALVTIDEKGAEAVGATAGSVTAKSFDPEAPVFRADRPFLFFILGEGGEVLFAGRTSAPKAHSASTNSGIQINQ